VGDDGVERGGRSGHDRRGEMTLTR
jgi:hypothetical protein